MDIIVTVSTFLNDENYCRFTDLVNKIINSGVNKFRINFKKINDETCERLNRAIEIIREIENDAHIILDLPYPYRKKRISFNGYGVPYRVKSGEDIELNLPCTQNLSKKALVVDSVQLPDIGEKLFYSDGIGQFIVTNRINNSHAIIRAQNSFEIWPDKSLYVVGEKHTLQDSICLGKVNHIIEKRYINEVMVSFVSTYEDLLLCRDSLHISGDRIIPKVETAQAIQNIEQIVAGCNKVMLARGDLALDLPLCQFACACNRVSEKVCSANKELLVATDILTSLETRIYPTRSDIIDLDKIINEYKTKYIVLSARLACSPFYENAINIINDFAG